MSELNQSSDLNQETQIVLLTYHLIEPDYRTKAITYLSSNKYMEADINRFLSKLHDGQTISSITAYQFTAPYNEVRDLWNSLVADRALSWGVKRNTIVNRYHGKQVRVLA